MSNDNIIFDNKIYRIEKSYLSFSEEDDTHVMNLQVYGFNEDITMFMSMFEVPLFDSIDKLDGKVIHVDFDGNRFEDDSLGTDINSYGDFFESNNFCLKKGGVYYVFNYYEILIRFEKITENVFDVNIELLLHSCNIKPDQVANNDLKKCMCYFSTKILSQKL